MSCLPICRYNHEVPEGASFCPKCGASIVRFARHMKVKLIKDYNTGIYTLTKGLKGEVLQETDDEYRVVFRNVMSRYGSQMATEPFWIPKKYLKKILINRLLLLNQPCARRKRCE